MVRLLTVKETSKECGVPENLLRNLIKEGKCPGIYSGTRFYINVDALENIIREGMSENKKREPIE